MEEGPQQTTQDGQGGRCHEGLWRRRWRVFRARRGASLAAICLGVAALLSLTAELWSSDRPVLLYHGGHLYAPIVRSYHPETFGIADRLTVDYRALAATSAASGGWALWPPNPWGPYESNKRVAAYPAPPSADNLLGTDDRGRDVLARLLYGFRYSLIFALLCWAGCSALALVLGGLGGYLGGLADLLGQRVVEVLSNVPQLLLLIYLISLLSPSLTLLVLATCLLGWIPLSYYVRGEALRARQLEYVQAARALGAGHLHILWRHVLPECALPVVTFSPFMIVANISGLAALDFLGLGLPPPTPSWGELLQQSQAYFGWAWWLALFPSLALFLTLLALALVGDGLRAAFDPRAEVPEAAPSPMRALRARLLGVLAWLRRLRAQPAPVPEPVRPILSERSAIGAGTLLRD